MKQLNWDLIRIEAKKRRKKLRFTQKQFSILSGVSFPTLIKFEKGNSNITLKNCFKILRLVGMIEK